MNNCCKDHRRFLSHAEADAAMRQMIEDFKRNGRNGKSFKRLNVFECEHFPGTFHVGRANRWRVSPPVVKATPPPPGPENEFYNHRDVTIRITERKHFYDGELSGPVQGFVSVPKIGPDPFGMFLDRCAATINEALDPA